jgi:hypothetical protein
MVTETYRKATSFFDFINVELYTNPEGYSPRVGMPYYRWSARKKEWQEHRITEATQYEQLKKLIERGLIYINI